MTFGSIVILSFGIAMDATAVAATRGVAVRAIRGRHILLVAAFFGGFQALMPVVGWGLGAGLGPLIEAWDHWVAFVLLGGIGGKMLWEAWGAQDAPDEAAADPFALRSMLLLALATSIDALAVGITLPMLDAPFFSSVATIGVVTALLSVLGLYAGRHFGNLLHKRLDIVGGLVLIGLGAKILLEHLSAT